MVARKLGVVQANASEHRHFFRNDARLFTNFPLRRLINRFTSLNAATRQQPPRRVGVLHQQHPLLRVKNRRARAQRHSPRLAVKWLQHNPRCKPECVSFYHGKFKCLRAELEFTFHKFYCCMS